MNTTSSRSYILPVIVLAQFCCTSLWFAGNGVMRQLIDAFGVPDNAVGTLTSAVQFGFIMGTLVFAVLTITDRFSPSRVFLVCALAGATCNAGMVYEGNTLLSLVGLRALTGFFLAGIYPVGMKIAADYFDQGLGTSLGYLVGALVVGTAFPHFLLGAGLAVYWPLVLWVTSALALAGGLLMYFLVPDGPFRRVGQSLNPAAFLGVFRRREFRTAAFGYFGHMWELYAFWTFVPSMLMLYLFVHGGSLDVPFWSFIIIAAGGLACVAGGYLARGFGERRVATAALALSGLCCLLAPWAFRWPRPFFLAFLVFWGLVVIMDSPLFSTLVARAAPPEVKGTALTILNCIGYAITIVSIQLVSTLFSYREGVEVVFWVLVTGPALGLLALAVSRPGKQE